jgi:vesicle-fusing ATPase
MGKSLKVSKLPGGDKQAYSNVVIVNENDFNEATIGNTIYINFCNSVFQAEISNSENGVSKGQIGMSNILRSHFVLPLKGSIEYSVHTPKKNNISKISLTLSLLGKNRDIISFHEEDFKDHILSNFKTHYFYSNQPILTKYKGYNIVIKVTSATEGYINDNTEINLFSESIELNFASSNILSRELFQDDFNFENIGIGGLDSELMGIFRRALSSRAIKPSIVDKLGIKHVKGVLLYGPPGSGKTLIARNIGNLLTNKPPKVINGPEILNKYVGQSEENIRTIFKEAQEDQNVNGDDASLHIIIFDEIDAICKKRGSGGSAGAGVNDTVVNQLLSIIDGINQLNNIFIIAMTNRKDLLDDALIRPGRIEIHVKIELPDFYGRKQIFGIHTKKMETNKMLDSDFDKDILAKLTENYSGAEIEAVVKNASAYAVNEQLRSGKEDIEDEDIVVTMAHLTKAVYDIKPAFGNSCQDVVKHLPKKFILPTLEHKKSYEEIISILKKMSSKFTTILVYGLTGCGKSTLVNQIIYDSQTKYSKIVRPMDTIRLDEHQKSLLISDTVIDAYLSDNSLVVIDDIEIMINFAQIGHTTSFSNKLYQTLMTVIKSAPENPEHKLTIVVTCGNRMLRDIIGPHFDQLYELPYINTQTNDINKLFDQLSLKSINEPKDIMSIKELVNTYS